MTFFRNRALWILLSSVGLFWLAVWALGSDLARDVVDMLALFVSIYLSLRFLPHAWDAFRKGGYRDNWRLLLSISLFWAGMAASSIWAFAYRWYDRPDWMTMSPFNGFFRFWIVAAGVLAISASVESNGRIAQDKVFYIVIAALAGLLCGVLLARTVAG